MSTITRIGAGTAATANNGASVTPVVHASTAAGDMVFVHTAVRNSGTGVPVAPAGWTTLVSFGNEALFARIWQASDVAPAFTFTGGAAGDDTIAQAETYRGVSAEGLLNIPTAATLLNGSAANIAYPALTVAKDRCLVFLLAWKQSDITTLTTPAGMTAAQLTTALVGNDEAAGWRFRIQTTATNIGAGTLTTTGGVAAISRAFALALKPAASISVIAQDVYPARTLISVTDLTLGDAVAIYRSVAGVRTLVQGATSAAVTDPSFLRVDAALPFGVPVSYVAVVNGIEYATAPVTYTLAGGKVAVTDAISALAAEVVIWAWPRKVRDRQATIFRPAGRNVVVSGNLSLPESDVELYTDAYSSTESLVELIENATQGIVQIRQPGGYDGVDGFYAVTGYAERRYSQDGSDEKRIHELHIVEVDGWAAAFTALGFTYADLATAYTGLTYANVAADYATYLLLAQADLS
jgi:hypothetical protein